MKAVHQTQKKFEERGIDFLLFIAPNKENIYAEYMPDNYSHSEESSTDLLVEYLIEEGISVVSAKQELLKFHNDYQLYYRHDTHWNQLGAYIGVRSILSQWKIELPNLEERKIAISKLSENYYMCASNDLAKMIGLLSVFNDEMEYEIEGTESVDWNQLRDEPVSHYCNQDAELNAVVLLVGDSFRVAMIPALSEVYRDVYVVHRNFYSQIFLDEIQPDYVIAEYVERYSRGIKDIDFLIE